MKLPPRLTLVIFLVFIGALGYNRVAYRKLTEDKKPQHAPTLKLDVIPLSKLLPGQYRVIEKISRVPTKQHSKMDWLTIKVQDITEHVTSTTHIVQVMQLGSEDDVHLAKTTFIKNLDGSTFQKVSLK